jgi:hypothetical protein
VSEVTAEFVALLSLQSVIFVTVVVLVAHGYVQRRRRTKELVDEYDEP